MRLFGFFASVFALVVSLAWVSHAKATTSGGTSGEGIDAVKALVQVEGDYRPGEIVINTDQRQLYLMTGPGLAIAYPIAVPGEHGEKHYGKTKITKKRPQPYWYPTNETRERVAKKSGKVLPSVVEPGDPENALGDYALNLGWPLIRIHGTNNPSEIGHASSAGCFRMHNHHVTELAKFVKVGTAVTVLDASEVSGK